MDDLAKAWDVLRENLPNDHAEAAEILFDRCDLMADRIEELEAIHANDVEEIARWREIVSGRTISENFEVVWRERVKRLEIKLQKAMGALDFYGRGSWSALDDDLSEAGSPGELARATIAEIDEL